MAKLVSASSCVYTNLIQFPTAFYFFPLSLMLGKTPLGMVAGVLTLIGALNWGLVGVGDFLNRDLNVVEILLGAWPLVVTIVYVLVGLSALFVIFEGLKK